VITSDQLQEIAEIEHKSTEKLQSQLDALKESRDRLARLLAKCMSDAQREDRGALSEVGRELEDVPRYLERSRVKLSFTCIL